MVALQRRCFLLCWILYLTTSVVEGKRSPVTDAPHRKEERNENLFENGLHSSESRHDCSQDCTSAEKGGLEKDEVASKKMKDGYRGKTNHSGKGKVSSKEDKARASEEKYRSSWVNEHSKERQAYFEENKHGSMEIRDTAEKNDGGDRKEGRTSKSSERSKDNVRHKNRGDGDEDKVNNRGKGGVQNSPLKQTHDHKETRSEENSSKKKSKTGTVLKDDFNFDSEEEGGEKEDKRSAEQSEGEGKYVNDREKKQLGSSKSREKDYREENSSSTEDENDQDISTTGDRSSRTSRSAEKFQKSPSCSRGTILKSSRLCVWFSRSGKVQKQFHQAKRLCTLYGGELFRPDSETIVEDIKLAIDSRIQRDTDRSYWIGLTKNGDSYQWADGATLSWVYWAPSMKFDRKSADCVVAVVNDDHKWTDEDCHRKHSFICQFGTGKKYALQLLVAAILEIDCQGANSGWPFVQMSDGNWSLWATWSDCSVKCGSGNQVRKRKCDNPAPSGGGQSCHGDVSETRACRLSECEVDGNWSVWGSWSGCSATCGTGNQDRHRVCNNPAPSGGGERCHGDNSETKACNLAECEVDGNWSVWKSWSACSATCGIGDQVRQRVCNNPAPSGGGQDCHGHNSETQTCKMTECPADGNWSVWEAWSACSVTCGTGNQDRQRKCNNPAPSGGGKECNGDNLETQACNLSECPVDGDWSLWEHWSTCSATCGTGNQVRQRVCNNPAPSGGGQQCVGDASDTQTCHVSACIVDGHWSAWEAWSACSVTCGTGNEVRSRKCNNPSPSGGGQMCDGNNLETQSCEVSDCIVDDNWSEWEAWTDCSVTCGTGRQTRMRKCDDPAPSGGGQECQGGISETQSCELTECRDKLPLKEALFEIAAKGYGLQGYELVRTRRTSLVQCALDCVNSLECKSFNFEFGLRADMGRNHSCVLNSATRFERPLDYVTMEGYQLYSLGPKL